MGLSAEQARQFLTELSGRTGASVAQSDIDELQRKNPDDVAKFQSDLSSQYEKRGAPTSHRNVDSQSLNQSENRDPRTENAFQGNQNNAFQGKSGGQSVMNSWAQVPDSFTNAITEQNALLKRMEEANQKRQAEDAAKEAAFVAKRDALYGELQGRAKQSLEVSADDPIIKNQVDAFRNSQTRSMRDYLSDVAEAVGSLANLSGERRMAHERSGIATSAMQAELMGREKSERRNEIMQHLNSLRGMLSAEQQANLTRELDTLDNEIAQINAGFQGADLQLRGELGRGGLALQSQLGNRGLDLQSRGLDLEALMNEMRNRQFYDDLGLRAEDRASYYDLVRRGLI